MRHGGLGQPHLGFRQRERPAAVVVSICAPCPVSTRRPTPRADRSCTVLTRWARVRPRRSSFQTTSTSPVRLEFDHKYTSGVIAWAPEDQPSDQDIDRVLDEVEQTALAGLAPDRYAWAAVRHRDADGGVHVYVLAARCDLETGKSLNIAPPGWE